MTKDTVFVIVSENMYVKSVVTVVWVFAVHLSRSKCEHIKQNIFYNYYDIKNLQTNTVIP